MIRSAAVRSVVSGEAVESLGSAMCRSLSGTARAPSASTDRITQATGAFRTIRARHHRPDLPRVRPRRAGGAVGPVPHAARRRAGRQGRRRRDELLAAHRRPAAPVRGRPVQPGRRGGAPGARLVKAFGHLGYHQLDEDTRPAGAPDRHAVAVAGDDGHAVRSVAGLVDRLGFDPVVAGPLEAGARFGPGSALFGVSVDRAQVERLLHAALRL